jgi:radical SAM protein with 4Fe4S-binding SPASM domain
MYDYFKIIPDIILKPLNVKHLPFHVQLETTTACNLKCMSCPRADLIETPKSMELETFKKIFDQIKPKRINLSGLGEPLANKDIFKISSYASQNGSIVNFPTNFTLARKLMNKFVGSGIAQLKISIDAASREIYLKVRQADKFDEIIEAIRDLNNLKADANGKKPEIRFNFALQKENVHELLDIVELADTLEVKSIMFQDLQYIGMEDKKPALVGDLSFDKLIQNLNTAAHMASHKKIKTNLHIWLRDFDLYKNKMGSVEIFKPNNTICYFPWFSTYIEINGNVKPCPHYMFVGNEGVMGNIFNEDFKSIWNNDLYKDFRKALKSRTRPFTPCKNCVPQKLSNLIHFTFKMLPQK